MKSLLPLFILGLVIVKSTAFAQESGKWGCAKIAEVPNKRGVALFVSQGHQTTSWRLTEPALFSDEKQASMVLYSIFLNEYCDGEPVTPENGILCCKIK